MKTKRRRSTAAELEYPMFVMKLETLLENYGGHGKKIVEPFQVLKKRGDLVNWEDFRDDEDAHIIFVSHEWLGWGVPDPDGVQIRTLCRVFQRFLNEEIEKVEHGADQVLYFGQKHSTGKKVWKQMLSNAYVWFDWISMPQPGAEDENTFPKEQMKMLIS